MSLSRQLWAAILVSMLLALCGSLVASLHAARNYLAEQLTQKNTDNATALALSLSQGDLDDVRVELAVAAMFDSGHYELIRVTSPAGKTIVERTATGRPLGAPAWFVQLLPIAAPPGSAQVSQGWKQYGTVTLASASRFAYASLWKSAAQVAGTLLVAGLIAGYLGSLILRRLIPPLKAVVEQATGITQRRFATIPVPRVAELAQLANAMNTMVGTVKSMFEHEAARLEEVRREANYDPVTRLPNRGYFLGRLAQTASEEGVGGVLALARVANLATINHDLGRASTDELLRGVAAQAEAAAAGHPDAVAGRLGGADFALLLPGRRDANEAAQALLQGFLQVAPKYDLDPQHFAHVGALLLRPGLPVSEALARVDAALAESEARGTSGASIALDSELTGAMPMSAEQWATTLRLAIDRKWVRLQPFPLLDMRGAEVHWECPLRLRFNEDAEWQPAGRFLPVAERLGLTAELDLLAVELAFGMLQTSHASGELAINLSPQSVADAKFRASLLALVSRHHGDARRLWLEVSEGGALLHLQELAELCRGLAKFGCQVGIEHFGREFGQIGRLHDIGLAYLKVDSSFVQDIEQHEGNLAFLRGLRSIASAIGLRVYAEGVRTQAEIAQLAALGFDGVTGPGVKRP